MTGLLLINLGTPDEPTTPAVRRYLRQFLSDPRVIDINPIGRALLLYLFILPTRPAKSAAAYRQVWMTEGSPLLVHSRALTVAVQHRLGAEWAVELGMRYGQPSIESALEKLHASGCEKIVVLPLYPQYSSAATGSSVEEVYRLAGQKWVTPMLSLIPPFYADAGFLDAFAERGRPLVGAADHVLFSFHGLPERQIRKADPTGTFCLAQASCCDRMTDANRNCYRAQSFATARALAERLAIPAARYSVSFQSRLGRTPWITPHTDVVLPELARAGKKRLVVFSPAFVADCLETLEEIAIRARRDFKAAGGEELTLVPSLNAETSWVDAVIALVHGRERGVDRAV